MLSSIACLEDDASSLTGGRLTQTKRGLTVDETTKALKDSRKAGWNAGATRAERRLVGGWSGFGIGGAEPLNFPDQDDQEGQRYRVGQAVMGFLGADNDRDYAG